MTTPRISVLTLNTYLCRIFGVDLAPSIGPRAELIAKLLGEMQPDVVCLQEVWDEALAGQVAAPLQGYEVVHEPHREWLRPMGCGLLIATRLPVLSRSFAPIPGTWRPRESIARRGVLHVTLQVDDVPVTVSCTHLGIGLRALQRRQQQALIEAVRGIQGPHILCGDTNVHGPEQIDGSYPALMELRTLGYEDALARIHGAKVDELLTVDPINPLLREKIPKRLDYIFTRGGGNVRLTIEDAQVCLNRPIDGLYPSDHYGVWARLAVECGSSTGNR